MLYQCNIKNIYIYIYILHDLKARNVKENMSYQIFIEKYKSKHPWYSGALIHEMYLCLRIRENLKDGCSTNG